MAKQARNPEGRAVFLDRDGTIIHDVGYPKEPALVRLLPGAAEALVRLKEQGFRLIVVSNQSGVGRGLVTTEQAEAVHQRVVAVLAEHHLELDGAYYCPHSPEANCPCRKPKPGLIQAAVARFDLDLARCWLIGDKSSDVEAGQRVGCRTILLRADPAADDGLVRPDGRAADWPEAVRLLLAGSETQA